MTPADYPALRLLDVGAQLVEVLPAGEHYETHLPVPSRRSTRIAESGGHAARGVEVAIGEPLPDVLLSVRTDTTALPQSRTRDIFTRPAANTPPATGKEQAKLSSCV